MDKIRMKEGREQITCPYCKRIFEVELIKEQE